MQRTDLTAGKVSVQQQLTTILNETFAPTFLEVKDESHLHAGHAGARPGGESHFRIVLVSRAFEGETRVARQRAVNGALSQLLAGPIHALAMKTATPEEWEKQASSA
ncbi:MAG: BolA family protein [Pseudomonadota bacterium]